VYRELFLQA